MSRWEPIAEKTKSAARRASACHAQRERPARFREILVVRVRPFAIRDRRFVSSQEMPQTAHPVEPICCAAPVSVLSASQTWHVSPPIPVTRGRLSARPRLLASTLTTIFQTVRRAAPTGSAARGCAYRAPLATIVTLRTPARPARSHVPPAPRHAQRLGTGLTERRAEPTRCA